MGGRAGARENILDYSAELQDEKVEEAKGEEKMKKDELKSSLNGERKRRKKKRTLADCRKEWKANKERRKNKPAPAPKKPEGFGYSNRFWHAWVGKENPR